MEMFSALPLYTCVYWALEMQLVQRNEFLI